MLCLPPNPLVICSSFTISSLSIYNHFKLKHYMHNNRFPPLHSRGIPFDLILYCTAIDSKVFFCIILHNSVVTRFITSLFLPLSKWFINVINNTTQHYWRTTHAVTFCWGNNFILTRGYISNVVFPTQHKSDGIVLKDYL